MPNPSELERQRQEAEPMRDEGDMIAGRSTEDRNLAYELRKLRTEMAQMADRAAVEIKMLRARNGKLTDKADAYDVIRAITGMLPQLAQGYEEDFAYRLERRAEELRKDNG